MGGPRLGRRDAPASQGPYRAVPVTSPKAQVSTFIETAILAATGTRTAAGPKPSPQQPVKIALAISLRVPASVTVKTGDLPNGCQETYSSPARPK